MASAASKPSAGRIVFAGNPWPKGHGIAELRWSGRIAPDGLWFDLHLKTEDYSAADRAKRSQGEGEDEEAGDDWRSKMCWRNYHRCTLSSTSWRSEDGPVSENDARGFRVATKKRPLDFAKLAEAPFRVDVSRKGEDLGGDGPRAFDVYLLGHDSVANHTIHFARRVGPATYSLAWDGRIALTYAGSTKLAHRFSARAPKLEFEGFFAAKGASPAEARELLAPFVTKIDRYLTSRRSGRVCLRPS